MTFELSGMNLLAVVAPAPQATDWWSAVKNGQLPFNWFDISVVVILAIGFTRGRKHGMSEEMMYLAQWIAMIFGAAWAYQPLGDYMVSVSVISRLVCFVTAYIVTGIGIKIFFSLIKRLVGGKLVGSNLFGSAEYYLGMAAGIGRFACILIFFLALLNARHFTVAEIRAKDKYNKDMYGSDFFPDLHDIQSSVFVKSFVGPKIHDHLALLLIKPTDPEDRQIKRKEVELP
jgi:uncharacterized membrane protein required for colicin V production